ncbi:MAG TPA: hypothetical protein DD432_03815 [Eubacterium sp.]|nr:hypothetical protein [Eubacterium sp.]
MAMIKGITVVLVTKVKVGTDEFNAPVYEQKEEEIHNVLVAPASSDDIVTAQDLYGKKAVYTLAVPKGDEHDWTDEVVEFFGYKWKTFGFPIEGIESNIPLDWNKKVMVERYG